MPRGLALTYSVFACLPVTPLGYSAIMTLRVQHSFQGISGIAKDQYVNTFHFVGPIVTGSNFPDLATAIKQFYNGTTGTQTKSIAAWMAPMSDVNGAKVKMYDTDDPPHTGPVYQESYNPGTHGTVSGSNLPSEVAVCLSYSGAPGAGLVARTRGRIYIGPLEVSTLSPAPGDTRSRPSLDFRTDILKAATTLAQSALDLFYGWVVHSETAGADYAITRWWVDDAWDTQRRRGDAPTSRVSAGPI